jgi:hypothetical protein
LQVGEHIGEARTFADTLIEEEGLTYVRRKHRFCDAIYTKNYHSTKTGSGQTSETHSKSLALSLD